MLYDKPQGPMHDVLKKVSEELRSTANTTTTNGTIQSYINYITNSLRACHPACLPPLKSGRDYVYPASTSRHLITSANPSGFTASTANNNTNNGSGSDGGSSSSRRQKDGRGNKSDGNMPSYSTTFMMGGSHSGGFHEALLPSTLFENDSNSSSNNNTKNKNSPGKDNPLSMEDTNSGGSDVVAGKGVRHQFNAIQVLRLLLYRAECLSLLKEHEAALADSLAALEVSQGQDPEAYFMAGREYKKLLRMNEAVQAFDTGEALLRSISQAAAQHSSRLTQAGSGTYNSNFDSYAALVYYNNTNFISTGKTPAEQQEEEDADYWSMRGFTLEEVRKLNITKQDLDIVEEHAAAKRAASHHGGGNTNNHSHSHSNNTSGRGLTSPTALHSPLGSTDDVNASGLFASDASNPGNQYRDEIIFQNYGFSVSELSMWSQMSKESKALVDMRVSHTVHSSVLPTALTLLDQRLTNARGGLIFSIDNNTTGEFQLIGCSPGDFQCAYHFFFPERILPGSSGLALLHASSSWSGYSGVACYELAPRLCCFFYFDNPMIGGVKVGTRFCTLPAGEVRRAFRAVHGPASLPKSMNYHQQSNRGQDTNGTNAEQIREAANRAVRLPPSASWTATHTATTARGRNIQAGCSLQESMTSSNRFVFFYVCEMSSVRLRPVELLAAIDYGGAQVLKKLSATNQRFRSLVNHLPPPLFYDYGSRWSYPDYVLPVDRVLSPWTVHDRDPVRWRLYFDVRHFDREDFIFYNEHPNSTQPILHISADIQSRVACTVSYGDKRRPLMQVKESWVPFSNTLYLQTPMSRTFASVHNDTTQNTFRLTLGGQGVTNTGSGSGGASANARQEVVYVARKRVDLLHGAPVGAAAVPLHGGSVGTANTNLSAANLVGGAGGGAKRVVGSVLAKGEVKSGAVAGGVVQGKSLYKASEHATAIQASTSSLVDVANNSLTSRVLSSNTTNGDSMAATGGTPLPSYMQHGETYCIWRPVLASGASVRGAGSSSPTPAPGADGSSASSTNAGQELVAEVRVMASLPLSNKNMVVGDLKLYPGADALMVAILTFCILRW